ncbi:MAG: IclR family transcriptional regulator [Sciscionella sp.]
MSARDLAAGEHRTVTRVTTILETVAAAPHGVRLHTLVSVLDAPKSSVHGLVRGLVAVGYLIERDGGYRLGPAAGALLAPPRPALVEAARAGMRQLHEEFDETVSLAQPVGDSIVYLESIESNQVIRYSAPPRTRRPLYPTSSGKVVLAHMSQARRCAYLAAHVPAASRAAVAGELRTVAAEGFAINRGETLPDVSAAAGGLVEAGRLVGCIAVAGPTARIEPRLDAVAVRVRAVTREVSQRLG